MSKPLKACLFDVGGEQIPPFQTPFAQSGELQLLGTFSAWDEFQECVESQQVQVVAVNLDDNGAGLQVVEQIVRIAPAAGIIGVSGRSDPQTIIAAMRAGCNQFVCTPIDEEDLHKAIDAIRAGLSVRSARVDETVHAKRICVIGSSGGAGATTIACNLAVELAHITNRTCALVDMNLEFGDVGCVFDCSPQFTMADVCRDDVEVDRLMLANAIHELPCRVALLTRPENIDDAHSIAPEGVKITLDVLSEMYPFTVVDLPRTYSFMSAAAVNESDHILIVTQLSVPNIRNAARIYDCLLKMGANRESIEIVLNRFKANFERIAPDEVETHFKRPIFAMIPNDYRRVQSSLDLGHPVLSDEPYNSPTRAAIQDMARKLAARPNDAGEVPATAAASSGLLGRIWKRGQK